MLLLAIWLVYALIKNQIQKNKPSANQKSNSGGNDLEPQKTVKCKQCDLHIPENEALRSGDNYYCSEFHLKLSNKENQE